MSNHREPPHHNNLTCYTDYRCRQPECVERFTTWQRNRLRAVADGTWQPFVDATPVREHLRSLYAAGLTIHRVSELTGIDWNTLRLYTQPAVRQGRGMIRRTTVETQAKILAVQPAPSLSGRVDPTGTRRRIQALVAVGWPLKEIGPYIGVQPGSVRRLLTRGQQVYGTTAQNTIDAYEWLRDSKPQRHGVTDLAVARARRHAKRNKWAPPAYWADRMDVIDDPDFQPLYGVTCREIVAQDASWVMRTTGADKATTAERLGVTRSYIEHAFREYPQYALDTAA